MCKRNLDHEPHPRIRARAFSPLELKINTSRKPHPRIWAQAVDHEQSSAEKTWPRTMKYLLPSIRASLKDFAFPRKLKILVASIRASAERSYFLAETKNICRRACLLLLKHFSFWRKLKKIVASIRTSAEWFHLLAETTNICPEHPCFRLSANHTGMKMEACMRI